MWLVVDLAWRFNELFILGYLRLFALVLGAGCSCGFICLWIIDLRLLGCFLVYIRSVAIAG